jgi:pimeloyl-ACP methyl ester carboxylesterase
MPDFAPPASIPADVPPRTITREDGATIACHVHQGRSPGVIFFTGYKSDMTGQKALRLEEFCRTRGQAFVRFDYFGHGASSGAFVDGTIGRWADDGVFVLDHLTRGPQVLVGSSLGGWIMLLVARRRPERIAGLLGVAAAPDFTEDLILPALTAEQWQALEQDGVVPVYSPYDPEPTPVTRLILEEGRNHLVLREEIPLHCPVRLIHGMADPDVPWQTSLRLADRLKSPDVEVTLIKNGDHRLSEPRDLDRLCHVLDRLLSTIDTPGRCHP